MIRLLLGLLLVLPALAQEAKPAAPSLGELFDTPVGTQATFELVVMGRKVTARDKVTRNTLAAGKGVVDSLRKMGDQPAGTIRYTIDETQIIETEHDQAGTETKRRVVLKAPIQPGTGWSFKSKGGKLWSNRILKVGQSLTIGATTYKRVVVVASMHKAPNGQTIIGTSYLAPGAGIVKMVMKVGAQTLIQMDRTAVEAPEAE